MNSKEQNTERVSKRLTNRAGGLLAPPTSIIERVTEGKARRDGRRQLVDIVKEKAVEIREAESEEAASICKLNSDFMFQMASDQAVLEHREEMTKKQNEMREKLVVNAVAMLETKQRQMESVADLPADNDVRAAAMQHLEALHVKAVQGTIDRSQD